MTWLNSELIFCFEVLNNDNDNRREKDRVGGKVLATGRNITTVVTVDKDNIMIIQGIKKAICTVVTVDKIILWIRVYENNVIYPAVTVNNDKFIQGLKR